MSVGFAVRLAVALAVALAVGLTAGDRGWVGGRVGGGAVGLLGGQQPRFAARFAVGVAGSCRWHWALPNSSTRHTAPPTTAPTAVLSHNLAQPQRCHICTMLRHVPAHTIPCVSVLSNSVQGARGFEFWRRLCVSPRAWYCSCVSRWSLGLQHVGSDGWLLGRHPHEPADPRRS